MAVWSVVRKSELEGSHRLDAEYYQPYFISVSDILEKASAIPIRNIASCKHRKFKPVYNNFFKYIEIAEVNTSTGEINAVDILGENAPSRAQRIVREGDVIISTVRPNRNAVALITKEQNNYVCSTGFAVIKPKNIPSEYLFIYLKTKYSIAQLVRKTTASMYPAVNEKDILDSLIVMLSKGVQEEVVKIINEFVFLLHQSQFLYSQAEQILLEELGLKDLDLKDDLFYTTTFKEIKNNNRMDAEYYMPKYEKALRIVNKYNYKRLDSLGKFSKVVVKKKKDAYYKYIEIGDIDISTGEVNYKELQRDELPENAKLKILGGELIISKVRPTRGAVAIVPEHLQDNCLCSGAFAVFKMKSPEREYVQVFLRSKVGKALLGRSSTGTQYPTITDDDVKSIPIPILADDIVKRISSKVCEAHQKRTEAKDLLEQAKRKVEEMIEKEAGVR